MNTEQLLTLYERVAEAPDAIARLRRFVLDLAVRGKLVEQDPADESVATLLKRITADKKERAVSRRSRRAEAITPLAATNMPFHLPSSWLWVRFGDITISRDGERVPISKVEREQRARIYDYYGASGVIDKIDGYLFDKPLLLIGEDGANLINRSTPIAFMAKGKYWVNNHAHVLDGLSEDYLRFLELFINAIDLKPFVTGTAQPKMNQAKMNSIPVALPPLGEQQRIVAKVDELMTLLDRLEAARTTREATRDRLTTACLARLTAPDTDAEIFPSHARFALDTLPALTTRADQIKFLRQTIINLAVRGKLVEQDPADEPPIIQEQPIRRHAEGKLDVELPNTWRWALVSEVASARLGKMLDKAKNRGDSYPYLRNTNVHWFKIRTDDMKHIPLADDEVAEYLLQPGDVLICEGGHGIGRTAVWRGANKPITFQKALHRVRPSTRLNPDFFTYCCSSYFHEGIMQTHFTGVGIPHFTGKALSRLIFPLPPIAEQHRIVAKVDELMALLDRLETALTTADTTRARLLESLLHEALTPATANELEATE